MRARAVGVGVMSEWGLKEGMGCEDGGGMGACGMGVVVG
jgi:hypothetical protein